MDLLQCCVNFSYACVRVHAKSLQSCLTLCDPMDCSPPGSSVHGILQARALEWVAMPSSSGSPDPGVEPASLTSPALTGSLPLVPPYTYICSFSDSFPTWLITEY